MPIAPSVKYAENSSPEDDANALLKAFDGNIFKEENRTKKLSVKYWHIEIMNKSKIFTRNLKKNLERLILLNIYSRFQRKLKKNLLIHTNIL